MRYDVLGGVGARGELARVLDPITLGETDGALAAPVNAEDESAAALTVWASVGDTSGVHGSADVSLWSFDANGALSSAQPVPSAVVRASLAMPLALFGGYVTTHIIGSIEYETGLTQGPWGGLVDDARAQVSIAVTGSAGPARFFVALNDVFETDGTRVPAMEPAGRAFSAGFSWSFRN
jgi:hypothetical protein